MKCRLPASLRGKPRRTLRTTGRPLPGASPTLYLSNHGCVQCWLLSHAPCRYNSARSGPLRPEPVYRPYTPPAQARARPSQQEERRDRVQPVYRPPPFPQAREDATQARDQARDTLQAFPKPDFPNMDFNVDFEPAKFQAQAKHMEESRVQNRRIEEQDERNRRVQEQEERNTRIQEQEEINRRNQEERRRRAQEQEDRIRRARDQEERNRKMQEERTRAQKKTEEMRRVQENQRNQGNQGNQNQRNQGSQNQRQKEFSPPRLIEKFLQPVRQSEPFTSFVAPFPTTTPAAPATALKLEPEQVKPVVTKKPVFQYEKKNFREPLKGGARDQGGPHPLIRWHS